MSESKICPLFFASSVADIEMECRPDRCAWAYEGSCALVAIARSLNRIDSEGVTVYEE